MKTPTPKVVEYRKPDGSWLLCHVARELPEGILRVQIPNPNGFGWIIDLWPGEYRVVS